MTSQNLQQQVVSDYLQQHTIIHSLEKALNLAIEHQISSPEVFIADYLMKQRKSKALIQLQQIQLAGDHLILIIDFLGLLRYFKYPNFDGKTSLFPELAYETLQNLDLAQPFSQIWATLGRSAPLFQMIHKSVQSLLRESEPEALSRLLNKEKQLFTLQKMIIPIFEISGKIKIGLVMRKDCYAFANFIAKTLELKGKFPFLVSQNDKTFDVQIPEFTKLKFQVSDSKIPNFQEFLSELKNEKVIVEGNENLEGKNQSGKDAKNSKNANQIFNTKLSVPNLAIAVFTAFARLCEESNFAEFSKIFVQINNEMVNEMAFSENSREFENFLLTSFVNAKNDVILMINSLNLLGENSISKAQRAPSALKKGAKVEVPVKTSVSQLTYNFENAEIDILQATQHFYQLQNYEKINFAITVFSDFQVKKAIIYKEKACNSLIFQTDITQYYDGLATWNVEKTEEEDQYHVFYTSCGRPSTPVDVKGKGKAPGKEVVDVKKGFISKTMCGILENVDYQVISCESEIHEYMIEVAGLLLEKRGVYQ
ncbi:hypothetical protein SS50377_20292 [Spironucleus salmonicida]|uniref:Uncharacterized protein n=1 Tax=Spironucleus salmonicida TaxID=348837 RepID=V6LNQ0_9EUKA|nr:hypothetical protein SS50377_20292 [Spironucleus salmonicida]|eukprot:EST45346.1 Hypothetical protein SS50377_14925 [Spironucleus salmonicida]